MQTDIVPPPPEARFGIAPPLVKAAAIGFLVFVVLVIVGVVFLTPDEQSASNREAASQMRACKAYLHAEPKLTAALCNPGNWRQGDALDGNQSSLP